MIFPCRFTWTLRSDPSFVGPPEVSKALAAEASALKARLAAWAMSVGRRVVELRKQDFDRVCAGRPELAHALGERLGLFLGQACRGSLERVELGVYGDLRDPCAIRDAAK